MCRFEIKEEFYLDGKPFKIISGGMHYFRILPECWRDRLEKLKALGCNTVETYIAWNVHEPKKNSFCFDGRYDIKRFIELAAELGLWVIVRPSPYICAEWEFGGLPAWLLAEDGMKLRCSYQPFLKHVSDYFKELFKILVPLQITNGGPIILMQLENEYGYYGNDSDYMYELRQIMLDNGLSVPLITSDGPWGDALACGSIPEALPTGNFGSKAEQQFEILSKFVGKKPLMSTEFWIGWFDSWGCGGHMTTNVENCAKELDAILSRGSVNIYMFVGGTNFGFMNGANYYDKLAPDVTSYDYDALLTESGAITPKYEAFKKVISKYAEIPEVKLGEQVKSKAYGKIPVKDKVGLFETLESISEPKCNSYPLCMEKLGQNYGYILYSSKLSQSKKLEKIRFWDTNDRAIVFVDGKRVLTLYDRELLSEHELDIELSPDSRIDILVENMGRVNFGPKLEKQRKGIDGGVQINGHMQFGWEHHCLELESLDGIDFSKGCKEGESAFYLFEFFADEAGDTYLDFSGWGKGCAFINGFNLGRFWEIGPQKRLYVPAQLIKTGKNEIVIFETEGKAADFISLESESDLG
ncbi:MAG: Beta-galactosidase [Oscillospiraceae bacterium]|jgi:beta-galactosidase|nr:Beta-galactosidase [Oscillospiraceae bacterium]